MEGLWFNYSFYQWVFLRTGIQVNLLFYQTKLNIFLKEVPSSCVWTKKPVTSE